MNKAILTFLVFVTLNLFCAAQQVTFNQVQRDHVLMEVFSGTCCVWLYGVETAIMEIKDYNDPILIVRHDFCVCSDGPFENTFAAGRHAYYEFTFDPVAVFNGVDYESGGGSSSKYDDYAFYFEPMINQMTSYDLDLEIEKTSSTEYTAFITATKLDTLIPIEPFTLQLALCADKVNNIWNWAPDFEYFNCIQMGMYPDHNGTPVDFQTGNVQILEIPIIFDTTIMSNIYTLIGFLQNDNSQEIVQDCSESIIYTEFQLDAELYRAYNVPTAFCDGSFSPEIIIRNNGSDVLNSITCNVEVNDSILLQETRNTNLGFLEKDTFLLPEVNFNAGITNEISVFISEPNGLQSPEYNNDTINFQTDTIKATEMMIKMVLKTDNNPEETTWEIIDQNGNIVLSGGPYTVSNQYIIDTLVLSSYGCHKFVLYDSEGDGLDTHFALSIWKDNNWQWEYSISSPCCYQRIVQLECIEVKPAANFTSNQIQICEGGTVQYYDISGGDVDTYSWSFPGGTPEYSNEVNPLVSYPDTGSFNARLIVENYPFIDTFEVEKYIYVGEYPEVIFLEIPDQCVNWPPLLLTQGSPEGGEYSGPYVDTGYFFPESAGIGTHTIQYIFTNEYGCSDSALQSIYVDACVGFEERIPDENLVFYPNPSSRDGFLNYVSSINDFTTASLFSIENGLIAFSNISLQKGNHTINLKPYHLKSGIYILQIRKNQDLDYIKILLQ